MYLPGKGSEVNLPRKGMRIYFSFVAGPGAGFCVINLHRANDVASFARELFPRTFGFAMGSGTVFVPQVVVLELWVVQELFRALGYLFP